MKVDEPKERTVARATKTVYRNFPMVPRVIFGRGTFGQLGDILLPKRRNADAPFIYLVDAFFEGKALAARIPCLFNDHIVFVSADQEPKTDRVDALVKKIRQDFPEAPSGIVGIGGGSLLDLAKAVAVMFGNEGKSEDFQGWDLVPKSAIYHVGVPKEQWFYTGMDCFIHSVESLRGTYLNAFSQGHGEKVFALCQEFFLGELPKKAAEEKPMMASWHGGMGIACSQVGAAHALRYGLSYVLGTKHGLGNCLVFVHLEKYYSKGVALFRQMLEKQRIRLPKLHCAQLPATDLDTMCTIALSMTPLWENALGKDWKSKITGQEVLSLYKKP